MTKFILGFLLFPIFSFSQNYSIELSSEVVCENDLVQLTAKGCDATVLWQNGKVGRSIIDTLYTNRSYSFTCRNSVTNALLGSSLAVTVRVNPRPKTPFLFCTDDQIKQGKQAKIEVFGCENEIIWSNGANSAELIVRPLETTTYTVKCINEMGCESEPISRTIIVINEDSPNTPVVSIKSACMGESLLLKSGGCTGGEYIWYKNEILDNNQGFVAKEIGRGSEIRVDQGGEQTFYTSRCYFSECLGNESNRMYVNFDKRLSSLDLPRKVYLDEGEYINLHDLLPKPSLSTNYFEFRSGKSENSPLLTDVSKIDTPMSIYVTEVSEKGNCTSPVSKITIVKNNGLGLLADKAEIKNTQEQLKPESLVLPAPSTNLLTQQSTIIGAVISSEKENDELPGITIPQGFSPNGDGINDVFKIENQLNEQLNLRIYNRYGHLVYEKEDYKNEWDGMANNNNKIGLQDDTYYYVLRLQSGKQKIGFLTLKR